jgi:SOS regulatory protein LexA
MTQSLFEQRKKDLVRYYRKFHRLPSYDELASLYGVGSKGSLYKYVEKFVDEGLVAKSEGGRLIPTTKLYGLRVLGTVQAGFPTTAEEEEIDTLSLDQFLIKHPESSYMLTVSGDSMVDAGIMPGDMVIVERGKQPRVGDIVIAEVDHDWTMKYFLKRGDEVILRPANKKYADIRPRSELNVAGVVTSVVRKYA